MEVGGMTEGEYHQAVFCMAFSALPALYILKCIYKKEREREGKV